jgi:hypothetical protein
MRITVYLQRDARVRGSSCDILLSIATVNLALPIDILYTLDSASLLVKLKPRIFQRLPPFEKMAAMLVFPTR